MRLQEISIEITQRCPNNCIHCSSYSSLDVTTTMPYDKVKELIDDAIVLGTTKICLSGGEPFMHPNIIDIIQYVHLCGKQCFIYTSGIIWRNQHYFSIPKELLRRIEMTNSVIIVNYEAADSANYNRIMGTKCNGFRKMRSTIRKCVELGIDVETHTVPMPINQKQLTTIVKQCEELGVKRISFLRLVPQARAEENAVQTYFTKEQTSELREELIKLKESKNMKVRIGVPLSPCVRKINCGAGGVKLNVRYDGRVYPCEAFKNDQPSNFTRKQPDNIYKKRLLEIYNNSKYLMEIRTKLDEFQKVQTDETCFNQYYRK